MAQQQNIGEISVKVKVDTSDFEKGVGKVEKATEKLNESLSETGSTSTDAAIRKATSDFGKMKTEIAEAAKNTEELDKAMNFFEDAAAGAVIGDIGGAISSFKNGMKEVVKGMPALSSAFQSGFAAIAAGAAAAVGVFATLAPAIITAGKAIGGWLHKVNEARKAMLELGRMTREANEAIYDGAAAAAENVVQFRMLANEWSKYTPDEKNAALASTTEKLGDMGIAAKTVNDIDKIFIEQTKDYIDALVARAMAASTLDEIIEAQGKINAAEKRAKALETEIELLKEQDEALKAVQARRGAMSSADALATSIESPLADQIDSANIKLDEQNRIISTNSELIKELETKYEEFTKTASILSDGAGNTIVETLKEDIPPVIGSLDELNEKLKIARENYGKAATDEMRQYYAAEIIEIERAIKKLNEKAQAQLIAAEQERRNALGLNAPVAAGVNMQDLIGSNYGVNINPSDIGKLPTEVAAERAYQAMVEANHAMQEEAARWNETLNSMFGDAVVGSVSGGIQALTDAIMGVGDIDSSKVLAAFLQPFADMAVSMGETLIASGIGALSLQKLLTNPWTAIAAGTALVALGSLATSAIQKSINTATGSGGSSGGNSWTGGGALLATSSTPIQVEVTGVLSGQDIYLAGNNYQTNQTR